MNRWLALPVVVAALGVACANSVSGPAGDPSADDHALMFGACDDANVDTAPPVDYLALAEKWLAVNSVEVEQSALASGKTITVVVDSDVVSGLASEAGLGTMNIHASMLPGIQWALKNGGRVSVALGSEGLEQELVLFALIESEDGKHFFSGDCQYRALTAPLQALLGERYDDAMDGIVGLTSPAEIRGALAGTVPPSSGPVPVILNPETADESLLRELDLITVVIGVPDSWVGPNTICTRIREGWNECLDLESGRRTPVELLAYVGMDRQLEVWLLDTTANVREPISLVGDLDLTEFEETIRDSSGAVIRVDVRGSYSAAGGGSVSGSAVVLADAATWDVLLADPERLEALTGTQLDEGDAGSALP